MVGVKVGGGVGEGTVVGSGTGWQLVSKNRTAIARTRIFLIEFLLPVYDPYCYNTL
jgi:hypothetical protein